MLFHSINQAISIFHKNSNRFFCSWLKVDMNVKNKNYTVASNNGF